MKNFQCKSFKKLIRLFSDSNSLTEESKLKESIKSDQTKDHYNTINQ